MSTQDSTTTQTPTPTIDDQFKEIYEEISRISSNTKCVSLRVKDLQRAFKQECKPKKVKKHTVMHDPMTISSELLKYLGLSSGTKLTKSEGMKLVSNRVKSDGMQNKDNKRQFTPNRQLMKILNMPKARTITFVELNKHLAHHFTSA